MELNHQQESQTVFDAEGCQHASSPDLCVEVWPPVNDSQWWSFQKIGPDDLFLCMGLQQFSFVSLRVRFSGLPYPKRLRSTRDWHERSNEAFITFPLFQSVIGAFKGNRSCKLYWISCCRCSVGILSKQNCRPCFRSLEAGLTTLCSLVLKPFEPFGPFIQFLHHELCFSLGRTGAVGNDSCDFLLYIEERSSGSWLPSKVPTFFMSWVMREASLLLWWIVFGFVCRYQRTCFCCRMAAECSYAYFLWALHWPNP